MTKQYLRIECNKCNNELRWLIDVTDTKSVEESIASHKKEDGCVTKPGSLVVKNQEDGTFTLQQYINIMQDDKDDIVKKNFE